MAIHMNDISNEAKTIFLDVQNMSKRVLERFYEGYLIACKDVNKNWRDMKRDEQNIVFKKVLKDIKKLIVNKKDGGGAKDGLALSTVQGYIRKVKLAMIYCVPLRIAELAKDNELKKAKIYVREILAESSGTLEEKMVRGYEWVKAEQIKEKERLKAEANKISRKTVVASMETCHTMPDPDDYEDTEEDSDVLLQSGISSILAWLQTKSMKKHLKKDIKSAKVLRRVLRELTTYEETTKKEEKAERIAVPV